MLLSGLYARNKSGQKPNIIIFFTDDQATLDTKRYGASDLETPHMDALADDGVLFTQAYAHAVCCPARALLMTGRDNVRSNVNSWIQMDPRGSDGDKDNMNANELTIAQVLKDNGYKTGLMGKWHLGAKQGRHPLDFGFEEHFGIVGGFIDNYKHVQRDNIHDLFENGKEVFHDNEYYPSLVTEKALDFIDRHKEDPFFMYMAVNLPHYPMQADPEMDLSIFDAIDNNNRKAYAKVMASTDNMMGRVRNKLDDLELTDNTLFIFMSDNGAESVDRGYTGKWIGNKHTLLEGGIRLPCIISYPGVVPKGETRNQIVGAEDMFPTILEAAGIPLPTDRIIDGKSILPILKSGDAPEVRDHLHRQWQNNWAVIQGDWKLNKDKLYSLLGNEPEQQDLAGSNAQVVNRLQAIRNDWEASITSSDIGKEVEGIGCMDTSYQEYDEDATIRDQALCETSNVVSVKSVDIAKGIKVNGSDIAITLQGAHTLKVFDIRGNEVFTSLHTGNRKYSLSQLPRFGVYVINVQSKGIHYAFKMVSDSR